MKVSVVTLSFNQGLFLAECMESVVRQTYGDIEYIVVDPGSTDGSRELIQKHHAQIAQTVFEPDGGPADGLNKGFSKATGEIFCYLNADDLLLPGAIARAVRFFQANSDVDVICGNGYQIDEDGARRKRIFSVNWGLRRFAFGAANVVQQSTFMRRKAFFNAGGFNVANKTSWDGELMVDLSLSGANILLVPDFLGCFRVYPQSITGSNRLQSQMNVDMQRIEAKILGRDACAFDPYVKRLFNAAKLITNPRSTLAKFVDIFLPLR